MATITVTNVVEIANTFAGISNISLIHVFDPYKLGGIFVANLASSEGFLRDLKRLTFPSYIRNKIHIT